MKHRIVVGAMLPLVLVSVFWGCAGTLEEPERFQSGSASAVGSTEPPPSRADAAPAPAAPAATCPDVPKAILIPKCATAGCHSAKDKSTGLDLESPDILPRLSGKNAVNGPGLLVDPMNPDKSVVYTKCTGSPPFGGRMPSPAAPLDDGALECLRKWVANPAR